MRFVIAAVLGCIAFPASNVLAAESDCPTSVRPVISTHTLPPYPKASVLAGEEGEVLADVTIEASGIPSDTQLLTSSGYPNLDAATLAHLKSTWRWEAFANECPVRHMRVKVTMDLRDADVSWTPHFTTITMTQADFPPLPAGSHAHGTTAIAVELEGPGLFRKIVLVKSSGDRALDSQAQDIVRSRFKFAAGQMDGKPINTLFYLNMVWPERQ